MSERVVYKYPMLQPVMRFSMPAGAQVIQVHTQDGAVMLWALCTPEAEVVEREFHAFGTGHPITEDALTYVGSAHDVEGAGLVFHIFERPL